LSHWAWDAIFYHIYPLGLCGAPPRNDFGVPAVPRLAELHAWLPHLQGLGVNALYLGPLFESTSHGYNTVDYYHVDRRLGDDATLAEFSRALHDTGIRLVLDAVFNHVGRDFWAFRDVQAHGEYSAYRDWFHNLRFGGSSPYGDPFTYEGWADHYSLVKLNLANPGVREHLFGAVEAWIRDFGVDGLRLDAADCLDLAFMRDLAAFCRRLRPDFWLMGEVVHGDYRRWAKDGMLDSVTNYECYKGLYSSLADRNYFEIAYALNREFGEGGLYCGLPLYNFVDNHDVNRVASELKLSAHLFPLYCLLFTMPGVPSLYYGSEWGLTGRRTRGDDRPLRPRLELDGAARHAPQPDLAPAITRLARLRHAARALRHGDYRQLLVKHEQFAFARQTPGECVVVAINAASEPATLDLPLPRPATQLVDLLNPGVSFPVPTKGSCRISVDPYWARAMALA